MSSEPMTFCLSKRRNILGAAKGQLLQFVPHPLPVVRNSFIPTLLHFRILPVCWIYFIMSCQYILVFFNLENSSFDQSPLPTYPQTISHPQFSQKSGLFFLFTSSLNANGPLEHVLSTHLFYIKVATLTYSPQFQARSHALKMYILCSYLYSNPHT